MKHRLLRITVLFTIIIFSVIFVNLNEDNLNIIKTKSLKTNFSSISIIEYDLVNKIGKNDRSSVLDTSINIVNLINLNSHVISNFTLWMNVIYSDEEIPLISLNSQSTKDSIGCYIEDEMNNSEEIMNYYNNFTSFIVDNYYAEIFNIENGTFMDTTSLPFTYYKNLLGLNPMRFSAARLIIIIYIPFAYQIQSYYFRVNLEISDGTHSLQNQLNTWIFAMVYPLLVLEFFYLPKKLDEVF